MSEDQELGSGQRPVTDSPAGESTGAEIDLPIEPGSPSLENVVFVLLGVLVGLLSVIRLFTLFG